MCPDGTGIRTAQKGDGKLRRASVLHALLLVWIGATSVAAQAPVQGDCQALKQASARAQSSYNRAQLRLNTADRQYQQTSKAGEAVQAKLAENAARLDEARQAATLADTAWSECRERPAASGCASAASNASAAHTRLADVEKQATHLQSDVATLRTRGERSGDELASAQREVNSLQIALSAAVAAAGCPQAR